MEKNKEKEIFEEELEEIIEDIEDEAEKEAREREEKEEKQQRHRRSGGRPAGQTAEVKTKSRLTGVSRLFLYDTVPFGGAGVQQTAGRGGHSAVFLTAAGLLQNNHVVASYRSGRQ